MNNIQKQYPLIRKKSTNNGLIDVFATSYSRFFVFFATKLLLYNHIYMLSNETLNLNLLMAVYNRNANTIYSLRQ